MNIQTHIYEYLLKQSGNKDLKITKEALDMLCEYFSVYVSESLRQVEKYDNISRNKGTGYIDDMSQFNKQLTEHYNYVRQQSIENDKSLSQNYQIDFPDSRRQVSQTHGYQEHKELKSFVQEAFLQQNFTNATLIPGVEFLGEETTLNEAIANEQAIKDFELGRAIFNRRILAGDIPANATDKSCFNLTFKDEQQPFHTTDIFKHVTSPPNPAKRAQDYNLGDFVLQHCWQTIKGSDIKV